MPYAGAGLRAVAVLIDTALLMVVGYLIAIPAGGTSAAGFHIEGVAFFAWLAVAIGYFTVFESRSGATPGKRLVGLRVVKLDGGGPIDLRDAIVRNVLRLVDGLFFYLVGAVFIWTSTHRQRLGDRLAGTAVIRAPAASKPANAEGGKP